jgi:stearoyl-CoA desaturase (Delta-9 desaturase)
VLHTFRSGSIGVLLLSSSASPHTPAAAAASALNLAPAQRAPGKNADAHVRRVSPADRRVRIINLAAVLIPFAGVIAAAVLSWGVALNWPILIMSVLLGLGTSLGITVGFHRLFTHKSFQTPGAIRYIFGVLGSMAVQGPVIEWCGVHRRHHQHSDDHEDPHSPHVHAQGSWGQGIIGTLRGAYHAHMGWLFMGHQRGLRRYTADLHADPVTAAVNRQFKFWVLMGLVIPAVLGGLLMMSWWGLLLGFVWGGLVRIFIVHHITWSVNSVCHLWGTQPFRSHDESRNNAIVGILGLGEGWHNNHHAFPTSARHGLRWWEFDASWLVIKSLSFVGLAKQVRVPNRERMQSKEKKHLARSGAAAAQHSGTEDGQ